MRFKNRWRVIEHSLVFVSSILPGTIGNAGSTKLFVERVGVKCRRKYARVVAEWSDETKKRVVEVKKGDEEIMKIKASILLKSKI